MDSPARTPGNSRPGTSRVKGKADPLLQAAARFGTQLFTSDAAAPAPDQAVQTIETLLRIPALASGRTEATLAAEHVSEDGMVVDPDFLPAAHSLFTDPHQPPASAGNLTFTWRRVSGTLYFPTGRTPRLLQGTLNDGAFLGALSALAARQGGELLLELVVSDDHASAGVYTFQFFKHGCWQQVCVDNFLPCIDAAPAGGDGEEEEEGGAEEGSKEARLAFACSANVGELWPSLAEKAYAKIHGSYYALDGGAVHEALVDLTGGVGFKVRLDRPPPHVLKAIGHGPRSSLGYSDHPDHASDAAGGSDADAEEALEALKGQQYRSRYNADDAAETHAQQAATLEAYLGARDVKLWSELQSWLASGSIVGVSAKGHVGPAGGLRQQLLGEEPPEGLHEHSNTTGLVPNQVYSILEIKEVPSFAPQSSASHTAPGHGHGHGHAHAAPPPLRLVRLHCPWPAGQWEGAYARGSPEWATPSMAAHQDFFAPTMADEATFWMPYDQLLARFNRLHVCRLFPLSWHQLTLHCGWQGPSAGGPYFVPPPPPLPGLGLGANPMQASLPDPHHVGSISLEDDVHAGQPVDAVASATGAAAQLGGKISSTWCCNPQFRLSVRKAAEVVVCVAQQDPRVANRGHVPKRLRKTAIGMQIVSSSADATGRLWSIKTNDVVASIDATPQREIVVTFTAQPGRNYTIIPHTGRAGEESAFVLRLFGSQPLELEQLPAPLCLVLGGHWQDHTAGGNRSHSTWGSNPQYMLRAPHKCTAVLSLSRLDVRYALIKPQHSDDYTLSLSLVEPGQGPEGPGRRAACMAPKHAGLIAEAGGDSMEEVVLQVVLEPQSPAVIVPSLGAPGSEAPYELRIMSGVPLELVPLPEVACTVLPGEWTAESAGGCDVHPLWRKNPRFHVFMPAGGRARIELRRAGRLKHPVDGMIGFYLLRCANAECEIKGDMRRAVVAESTFVPDEQVVDEYELNGGCHYCFMPCTYGPGHTGAFTVAISSANGFSFKPAGKR